MTQPDTPPFNERKVAIDLFNMVWRLLEKPDRTPEEDNRMLNAAHASRYHWGEVGQPVNLVRGEWQVSHVYSILGRVEPALYHAGQCLDLCRKHDIGDFDLAYAYEALARANRLDGKAEQYQHYFKLAVEAGKDIAKAEDKNQFLIDIKNLESGQ